MAAMTSLTWNDLPGAATRAWGLPTLREMARDYLATLARQQPYGDVVRQRILRERIVDVFDPELIVIGGGVSESAPLFLDEAREHYAVRLTGRGNRPLARVRVAQLGEAAAVVGAAELAREHALAL